MHAPRATLRPARPPDLAALERLLTGAQLSTRGVAEVLANFVVAEQAGRLIGSVGFESYEPDALLRSAAVEPEFRGTGIGRLLVDNLLERARRRGIRDVYLLTTTAERWFPRFGFERTTREAVPEAVQAALEFREICSSSAVVMVKRPSAGTSLTTAVTTNRRVAEIADWPNRWLRLDERPATHAEGVLCGLAVLRGEIGYPTCDRVY